MAQLDIIQIVQSVPQQFVPYIILFGLAFFAVSLTKISWKIRLAVALAASIGVNLLMPVLLSPLAAFLNSVAAIGASVILVAVGMVLGRKKSALPSPAIAQQSRKR